MTKMPQDNQPPVEVIQGDRKWAAMAGASIWNPLWADDLAESVLRGARDDTDLVQAFAQHRLAYQSEAPALAGLEHAWLVEENASGIIHWIALEADSWPRTKVRRMGRRAERLSEDDLELEEYQTPVRRVKDANEALRFARKEDAEAFIALFDRFLLCPVATEHEWPSPAPSLPLADREAIARVISPEWFGEIDGRHVLDNYPGQHKGYQEKALAKADAILALSGSLPPSPVGESIAEVVPLSVGQWLAIEQARFLCDRLGDLDWCDLDRTANDFSGHVDPALSRLKSTLEALPPSPVGEGMMREQQDAQTAMALITESETLADARSIAAAFLAGRE